MKFYYSVRFYISPQKKRNREEFTPLRLKVWITTTQSYLYCPTDIKVTPLQWSAFSSDGTPTASALPKLAKRVTRWREAANLVLAYAAANKRLDTLTSEEFGRKTEGVKTLMELNQEQKINQPIVLFSTPMQVATCVGCIFRDTKQCAAPWNYEQQNEFATDAAAFNGLCSMRVNEDANYQPNPKRPPQPYPDEKLKEAAELRYKQIKNMADIIDTKMLEFASLYETNEDFKNKINKYFKGEY